LICCLIRKEKSYLKTLGDNFPEKKPKNKTKQKPKTILLKHFHMLPQGGMKSPV
jgi:hypothetical protein